MPIYQYKGKINGKIYEISRSISEREKEYIAEDEEVCEFIPWYLVEKIKSNLGIIDKNAEAWEKDAEYVKKCAPKYVKYRDGHREKFDPTRHC
jgi:hypothetical protein